MRRNIEPKDIKYKPIDKKEFGKYVTKIYKFMGKTKPKIHISDSYKTQKALSNRTKTKGSALEGVYNDKVRNRGLSADIKEENVEDLRKRYGNGSETFGLDKAVEILVANTPHTKGEQFFGAGFELFYSLNEEVNNMLCDFYKLGVYDIEYYENDCFACTFPVAIRFDEKKRLHGFEKPAIEFVDGNSYYLVRDVYFDADTWKKIQSRTMPLAKMLALPNIEQRCVALEYLGADNLLNNAIKKKEAKLLDTSERGNRLYDLTLDMGKGRFSGRNSYTYKLLRYGCPSTDRQYASFVPENLTKADQAMAWKFKITEEQYAKLHIEA